MRCLSIGQLVAGFIVITIVTMMLGFYKIGSIITSGLLVWYAMGFLVQCDELQSPSLYTGDGSGIILPKM
jgi:hypothetical protein